MKNLKKIAAVSMCMIMLFAMAACSKTTNGSSDDSTSTEITSSSEVESSADEISSEPESSEETSESSVASEESSEVEASSEVEVTAQDALDTLPEISVGSDEFKAEFKNNSIDKEYAEGAVDAYTVTDLRVLMSETVEKWKAFVDVVYAQALEFADSDEEKAEIRAEHEEWLANLETETAKINEEAQDAGSQGSIDAGSKIMELYRQRAAVLCNIVYTKTGTMPSFDDISAGAQG